MRSRRTVSSGAVHPLRFDDKYHALQGPLLQTQDGFYGVSAEPDCGLVYRLKPAGQYKQIATFRCDAKGDDPQGALIEAHDGSLYGTTMRGGVQSYGLVYRILPDGEFQTIAEFDLSTGVNPVGALLEGDDGNFYGTTTNGGPTGLGTVFSVSPTGQITVIHAFSPTDGYPSHGNLVYSSSHDRMVGTTDNSIFELAGPNVNSFPIKGAPSSLSVAVDGSGYYAYVSLHSGGIELAKFTGPSYEENTVARLAAGRRPSGSPTATPDLSVWGVVESGEHVWVLHVAAP